MRPTFKVPIYGNLNRSAIIRVGAQVGTDLYLPDGAVATLQTLAAALQKYLKSTSSSSSGSSGIGPISATLWSLIQDIPPNILQAAALNTTGLVTRKSTGDWITSVLTGNAGRIVVTHGDGNLGDPTIDLATISQGSGGALRTVTIDAYGRITANRLANLDDLDDVNAPAPVNGDALTFDAGTSKWVASPGGGYPPQLGYAGVL